MGKPRSKRNQDKAHVRQPPTLPNPRNSKALASLRGLRFVWCGTRRTVSFYEARFSVGLEFGRKFGEPSSNYK